MTRGSGPGQDAAEMYDSLAGEYDRFVDWPARLASELPFLERSLREADAHRVLDAACGTGMHAVGLAKLKIEMTGADASTGMVARARSNAAAAGAGVRFEQAAFGGLLQTFGGGSFDAILCLGNSLPHVQNPEDLTATLKDFAACLRTGGLLIIQNRNFDKVLATRERWMEPQGRAENGREWLFVRFYDFEADGSLNFHVLTFRRPAGGPWDQSVSSTRIWPLKEQDLTNKLVETGFKISGRYGTMRGEPFEREISPDLILLGRAGS
jgi:glycine/sarcosine N-methyltransferase